MNEWMKKAHTRFGRVNIFRLRVSVSIHKWRGINKKVNKSRCISVSLPTEWECVDCLHAWAPPWVGFCLKIVAFYLFFFRCMFKLSHPINVQLLDSLSVFVCFYSIIYRVENYIFCWLIFVYVSMRRCGVKNSYSMREYASDSINVHLKCFQKKTSFFLMENCIHPLFHRWLHFIFSAIANKKKINV